MCLRQAVFLPICMLLIVNEGWCMLLWYTCCKWLIFLDTNVSKSYFSLWKFWKSSLESRNMSLGWWGCHLCFKNKLIYQIESQDCVRALICYLNHVSCVLYLFINAIMLLCIRDIIFFPSISCLATSCCDLHVCLKVVLWTLCNCSLSAYIFLFKAIN